MGIVILQAKTDRGTSPPFNDIYLAVAFSVTSTPYPGDLLTEARAEEAKLSSMTFV